MRTPSQRLQNLPGNFFASLENRIRELEAEGCDVIRLDIGSPDLPPPPAVVEALSESARQPDSHGYQPHAGPPELRRAWAGMYRRVYGVELDEENEIVPLLGSKEGIFHLVQAWIDPGDVVLVPDPGYMTYSRAAQFAGGDAFPIALLPERGFLPDFSTIPTEILRRAKMIWLNYPNNPTGAAAGLDFFVEAVAFARRHDLLLCHDAAYSQVTLGGEQAHSLLEVPGAKEVAVEMNSLSKSHNLAGWRLGAAAGHPQALKALFKLKTNLDSGHFLPILRAAVAAMEGDQSWIAGRNEIYRQRRDLLVEGLRAAGLSPFVPPAAIYVWCPVPPGWTSQDFTTFLLEQAQISLAPGTLFGGQGEGYVRLALTASTERTAAAVERLLRVKDQIHRRES